MYETTPFYTSYIILFPFRAKKSIFFFMDLDIYGRNENQSYRYCFETGLLSLEIVVSTCSMFEEDIS